MNSKVRVLLHGVVIIVITVALFWRTGGHQFIDFDDPDYVTANPPVATGITASNILWAFTATHSSNWHPLTWISLMADAQLYGLEPGGYHLTNVIIHAFSAALLLLLLHRLTRSIWRSSFVAALFALHPLHVESVAWVAERKDLLSAFFFFLTLYLYAEYSAKEKKSLYLLTLFSYICGLMSKPMLVTVPVIMLLADVWPLHRLEFPELKQQRAAGTVRLMWRMKEKLPFLALSFLSALITIYAQHMGRAMNRISFTLGMENAALAYARYLAKMLWPRNLAIFYPLPVAIPLWQPLCSLLGVALISWLTIRAVRQKPYLMVGWFWYLVMLAPVIGLIPVGEQAIADRYTYLPLTGIFIIIAWGVPDLLKKLPCRRIILTIFAVGWLALLAFMTRRQLGYWRDSVTLFNHAVGLAPDSHTLHTMMGNALVHKGDAGAAIKEYEKALSLKPDYGKARNNLALLHLNLGNALSDKGDLDAAIGQYRQSLSLAPNLSGTHNNLGITLAKRGDMNAAIKEFQDALALDPNSADARNNLELALSPEGGH